jgi:L-asparaginase/Glu-tRNA(Gln) amidotransferase subunit D
VIEHASAKGATRKPTVEQVVQFTIGAEVRGMMPSMHGGGGGGANHIAFGTPRVDDRMHVTFLQTGGTIDKDYPRMVGGYAFEITEPAVGRILQNIPAAFTHDVHSVCRKDSTEITLEDRQVSYTNGHTCPHFLYVLNIYKDVNV